MSTDTKPNEFRIVRIYDAPVKRVWDAWTDPKHFSQWLPPTGFTMEFLRANIKPGGTGFYKMTNGSTVTMYGRTAYVKIERPHLIVWPRNT